VGSNPTPSAIDNQCFKFNILGVVLFFPIILHLEFGILPLHNRESVSHKTGMQQIDYNLLVK
jgi:hypothetical protein